MTRNDCPACHAPLSAFESICPQCGLVLTSYQPAATTVTAPPPVAPPRLAAGHVFADGRYTIQRLLSKGGMGTIYLASDHHAFDRTVVIKAMLDYFDPNDPQQVQSAQQRFLAEAQTLASLRHPAIPQIYTYFQDGTHNYIVMEYIEGHDLERRLTHTDPLTGDRVPGSAYPIPEVCQWGVDLCKVLEYLASRQPHPVVHHDIKPANLLLDSHSGAVRLVDFGTAKARLLLQAKGGVGLQKTSVYGTQGYAAPEQYQGESEPRSDVYALAATLYHLATDDDPGEHPFSFPQLDTLGSLGAVLRPALATDRQQRPTAAILRQQLEHSIRDPLSTRSIQTPNGMYVAHERELLQWCEAHWNEATTWLYGTLPNLMERIWGQNQTAQNLRTIVQQHPTDPNVGLDAVLRLLDPQFPTPQLQLHPDTLDFDKVFMMHMTRQHLDITNTGRGYVALTLTASDWLRFPTPAIGLLAGQMVSLPIDATLVNDQNRGSLHTQISLTSQHGQQWWVPATAERAVRSPDGQVFTHPMELVVWCEAHWKQAVTWIASPPPDALLRQMKHVWDQHVSITVVRHLPQNPSFVLDATLAEIDPHGFGRATPQVACDSVDIDFGRLGRYNSNRLGIANTGRRYVQVNIAGPSWLIWAPTNIVLGPGETVEIGLYVNHAYLPMVGALDETLSVRTETNALCQIRVRAQAPLWQRVYWRYTK